MIRSKFFTDIDDFELVGFDSGFQKHGTHDQKTHGSWATDGNSYDEIDAKNEIIMGEWRKKYRVLDKYLDSKNLTHSWNDIQGDPKAKKMRAGIDS